MMMQRTDSTEDSARRAVIQKLESLRRAGVTHIPRPPNLGPPHAGSSSSPPTKSVLEPAVPAAATGSAAETAAAPAGTDERAAVLAELARNVAGCTRCAALAGTRTQTVFGVGNPAARLAFLGEAPGADEDRQGKPFVGRAGKLLTDIIEKGMRLRREDVYIFNILKCRPPGNRNPLPEEAANCREYLDQQLAVIRPEFICCLGAVAAQRLLDTKAPIGKLRGRFFHYEGARVMCTYHPAYVLRNPAAKRQVWEDIQMLMAEMGVETPQQ